MRAARAPGFRTKSVARAPHNGVVALLRDALAVRLRDDGVVRVSGRERLAYLHLQLSQHLADAPAGSAADFLYLDAKGAPLAAGRAVVHAEAVFLVVPGEIATGFADSLERFKFLMEVQAEDVSGGWVVASIRGPAEGASATSGEAGGQTAHDGGGSSLGHVDAAGARSEPMTAAPHGEGLVIRDRSGGVDLLGPRSWVEDRVADLDLPQASAADWEAWRIAAGVPAWGREITPGRRPTRWGCCRPTCTWRRAATPARRSSPSCTTWERRGARSRWSPPTRRWRPARPWTAGPSRARSTSAADDVALALLPLDGEGQLPDAPWSVAGTPLHVRGLVGAGVPQPGVGQRQPAQR